MTKKGKAKPSEQLKHDVMRPPKKDHYVIIIHIRTEKGKELPRLKKVRLDWPYALVHRLTLKESEKIPWEADREPNAVDDNGNPIKLRVSDRPEASDD